MKIVNLKPETMITVSRTIRATGELAQSFTCTLREAVSEKWFDRCRGTIAVCVELARSEYENYNGCRPDVVIKRGRRPHVFQPGLVPYESIIWDGELVSTGLDDGRVVKNIIS